MVSRRKMPRKKYQSKKKFAPERRGAVYIGNLPSSFYEKPLYKFLKQFGEITKLKVARSEKTAKPMGWAYVEFQHERVAQIVSKTMDSYLMFNKMLKCHLIRNKDLNFKMFKNTNLKPELCLGTIRKIKNQFELEQPRDSTTYELKQQKKILKAVKFMKYTLGVNVDADAVNSTESSESANEFDDSSEVEEKKKTKRRRKRKVAKPEIEKTTKEKDVSKKTKPVVKSTAATPKVKRLNTPSKMSPTKKTPTKKTPAKQTPAKKTPSRKRSSKGEKTLTIEIDEVDVEIIVKTPPNVIKNVKKGKETVICDFNATTLKKESKKRCSAPLDPVAQNLFPNTAKRRASLGGQANRKSKENETDLEGNNKKRKRNKSTNIKSPAQSTPKSKKLTPSKITKSDTKSKTPKLTPAKKDTAKLETPKSSSPRKRRRRSSVKGQAKNTDSDQGSSPAPTKSPQSTRRNRRRSRTPKHT